MPTPVNSSGKLQVDNVSATQTLNAGFTFTAGRDAFASFAHYATGGATIASVTIGGTAATRDIRATTGGQVNTEIWRAQNIVGGTSDVVIAFTGGTDHYFSLSVEEYAAGVFINPALDSGTENSASGNSTSPGATTAISTSQADTHVYGAFSTNTGSSNNNITGPTSGTSAWVEQNSSAHQGGAGGYRTESSTGSKSMGWTMDSGQWVAVVAAYKLAPVYTLDQEGFRVGRDDNTEASHSWDAAQDNNVTAPAGETRVLAFVVNATGTPGAKTFKLQYRKVGDPSWSDMPVQ